MYDRAAIIHKVYIKIVYSSGYSDREYIGRTDYDLAFLIPYLKSIFYTLSSLGILELAYNLPEAKSGYTSGSNLSDYDGLEYIKLSKFGKYLFDLSDNFEMQTVKNRGEIVLDENRLYLYLNGVDPIKESFLDKVAQKIKLGYYRIDYATFLKNIPDHQELSAKIKEFTKLTPSLPDIWLKFIRNLEKRMHNPLERCSYHTFEVYGDSELFRLFSIDPILIKYHLKAEGKKILVEHKDLAKIKRRLKELGYLWNY